MRSPLESLFRLDYPGNPVIHRNRGRALRAVERLPLAVAECRLDDRLGFRSVGRCEGLDEVALSPHEDAAQVGELVKALDAVMTSGAALPDAAERQRGQSTVGSGCVHARPAGGGAAQD